MDGIRLGSCRLFSTTSGPIPFGSPRVMARRVGAPFGAGGSGR